ncbi:MAG: hypothetical protein PHP13_00985 [Methanomicrobium sp.]|nr:hypothetical protein [Methanomicrobium sp.]
MSDSGAPPDDSADFISNASFPSALLPSGFIIKRFQTPAFEPVISKVQSICLLFLTKTLVAKISDSPVFESLTTGYTDAVS